MSDRDERPGIRTGSDGNSDDRSDDASDSRSEVRWLSYDELAHIRGISKRSAFRIANRHKWDRRKGNDGTVRVAIPLTALVRHVDVRSDIRSDDQGPVVPVRSDVLSDKRIMGSLSAVSALASHWQGQRRM